MIEPELEQLRVSQNCFNPLHAVSNRLLIGLEDFGRTSDHGERPANLVHDSGQEATNLHELLVQHRQPGHLAKLNEPPHATKHDCAGGILGDVVVGPRFQAREDVGIVVANCQHQDGNARDLVVGANRAADLEPAHVRQVHVQDDDVRAHFTCLRKRLATLRHFINRVATPTKDGP